MIDIKQDIKPYMDTYGFIQPYVGQGTYNGVLYTSEYIVILNQLGLLTEEDKQYWLSTMYEIIVKPGLIERSPTYGEQEQNDDYIGFLAAAKLCDPHMAKSVYLYGVENLGSFNNVTPGKWTTLSFLWRMPQMIPHTIYASGGRPNALLRFIWAISVLVSCWRTPTSDCGSRWLGWLIMKTWDGYGWFCRFAVNTWVKRLLKDYPNGMIDVSRGYFGSEHPFTKCIGVF